MCFGAQAAFDAEQNRWVMGNGQIQAVFQLTPEGYFRSQGISDLTTGDQWLPSTNQPSTPVNFQAGGEVFDAQRQYDLLDQFTQNTTPSGVSQYILLRDLKTGAQITVMLEIYDGQPVLHYGWKYRNPGASQVHITTLDMLPWSFNDAGKRYTAFRVDQWSLDAVPEDFESFQSVLDPEGSAFEVYSGAHGDQCGWLAVRDSDTRGLFAGWEFDGRTKATIRQVAPEGEIGFSASLMDMNHPVDSAADFQSPWAFLGLFHGDFDEAGYRTQRFVEAVLAQPLPDAPAFPYVSWDSWGYQDQIDEGVLRRNAGIAAALGVELFVVDLGWARSIGDWYEDPTKFPNGLAAVSDTVHSLGMKFGLHFALTEADPNSPVLRENPDWTSTENDNYHNAVSLCLSNQPARDWLIQQGTRMIDDYHVDWILQDGENMVKECTKSTHTHDPADSNYSNAVDGLNAVISAIRTARPNVSFENCEDGGNMMTFNMVKNYVTSVTNDASGSLESRRAVYGATYPFPPRFAERYMPDTDGISPYATDSYRFGGPWVLMTRLDGLTADQKGFLADQIGRFKAQRTQISSGKVFHLAAPAANATDAIQSYDPVTDSAIAMISRAQSDGPEYQFHPKGLNPAARYTVWFEIDPSVYSMGGAQLMTNGVRVKLPTPFSSDVAHIEAQ
ncbi:MAG TPA: alpha-galactosidase [Bryobacteraceae bacterium]|nr:alpha-galactosidase [Bryobacteraceae bacterium]